jgi:glutamate 5-kinase
MENEVGYINARNSINCLLDWDVLPIINENDCVATEEISLGDNDNLASWVVDLMQCKLMVFLTDVDGLYDCNPFKNKKANLLKLVDLSTKEVDGISTEFFSQIGTGGMATKILAAKKAAKCGASTVVLNAKEDITKLCSDSDTKGSLLFLPSKK